jgi:hypothetical protein
VTGGVIYFLILIKISNNARSRLHMFSARLDAVLMFLTIPRSKNPGLALSSGNSNLGYFEYS